MDEISQTDTESLEADGARPQTAPPERSAGLTPHELIEAKKYGRLQLVCSLLDKAIDVVYLSLVVALFAVPLDRWLSRTIESRTLRLAAMFLIVTGLHMALSAGLSFYSGYILEHRFGLSRQTAARWLLRYLKRNTLAIAFGLLLFVGLYWVIWLVGSWWWVVAAGLFFLVSVLVAQLVPVLILPLFYKIEKLDVPGLQERIARIAEGTGISIEGVYRMDLSSETVKANAMLAGLGRTRQVLLGDTLLASFTAGEIEVIFAHEIGHHVYRHIRKMIFLGLVYSVAGFFICDFVLMAWTRRFAPGATYDDLPVATLPLVMLVLTLLGLLLEPIQNAVSRHFERQCDRYALERTGLRAAYVSAFQKLARLNKNDPDPHPLEVFLFHSHPPIAERLALAER